MMTMSVVSYEFERLVAFVIIILVDRVILDTTCLIQRTRFSRSKDARIMIMKEIIFFECMMTNSRMSALTRRKSRSRFIMMTSLVFSLHFVCSNTSYSKLRCALFSLFDSQKSIASRSAIKLTLERQRISIVRHLDMFQNIILNLNKFIVMPTISSCQIY